MFESLEGEDFDKKKTDKMERIKDFGRDNFVGFIFFHDIFFENLENLKIILEDFGKIRHAIILPRLKIY